MENNTFNILNQLTQEQKSLWRIESLYIEEAADKDEKKFWTKLRNQKRKNVAELSELAKKLLK